MSTVVWKATRPSPLADLCLLLTSISSAMIATANVGGWLGNGGMVSALPLDGTAVANWQSAFRAPGTETPTRLIQNGSKRSYRVNKSVLKQALVVYESGGRSIGGIWFFPHHKPKLDGMGWDGVGYVGWDGMGGMDEMEYDEVRWIELDGMRCGMGGWVVWME